MKEAEIPGKLYFKIGEVATIAALRPSVLRFWESEFPMLNPQKSRTGQRLYSRKDLDMVLEIKRLLYQEKHTIEGAKRRIARGGMKADSANKQANASLPEIIEEIKNELRSLRDSL